MDELEGVSGGGFVSAPCLQIPFGGQ
jgi:hypothetical protein